jgi:penicillin-binding protein 1C
MRVKEKLPSASADDRHKLKFKRWALVLSAVLVLLAAGFLIIDSLYPVDAQSNGYSTILYSNDGIILHGFLSKDDKWRIRAEYSEISDDLKKAIIFKEDRHFYYHPGLNILSIGRALYNNSIKGRRTSGASTITMQLARLLSPAERTMTSKLREAFRALQLEYHYSKDEILTMYMNLLPYGGNIEGVKAAAMIYFGQLPIDLSPAQITMLTVIPNNPNVLMPANRSSLTKKRNFWIRQLGAKKIFTAEETEDALNEGFESERYGIPRIAPHLAFRYKKLQVKATIIHGNRLYNSTDRIHTTIDLQLQSKVETSMRNYIRSLRSLNITNASVLVVNNRTMEVEAYAGSAGYEELEHSGQVDGIRAIRVTGFNPKTCALYARV